MKPEDYFPAHYREDLATFSDGKAPSHGPYGVLCGWTLGFILERGNPSKYVDPSAFICVLYNLNLLHQGIYAHMPAYYDRWLLRGEGFVDMRGCLYYHGGISHNPDDLIRFVRESDYIPDVERIPLSDDLVKQYTEFFFRGYIGELLDIDPEQLIEILIRDPDCRGLERYLYAG